MQYSLTHSGTAQISDSDNRTWTIAHGQCDILPECPTSAQRQSHMVIAEASWRHTDLDELKDNEIGGLIFLKLESLLWLESLVAEKQKISKITIKH